MNAELRIAPAAPAPIAAPRARQRIESIDLVRGLVMVIMALDHTRDYFHNGQGDPTDLAHVSAALFLTRLVTHLCAPTFVFLAGTAAYLSGTAGASQAERSRHLVVRGLWLVLLELTLVHFGWTFNLSYDNIGAQVIWALGWSMVALAGLIWLPQWAIAAVGGGMVLLHNLLDRWGPDDTPLPAWLWHVLHVPGSFPLGAHREMFILYPLIPWIGVMALGYVFGAIYLAAPEARRGRCLALGLGALAAFVLLRATNVYGDASHWAAPAGRPPLFTVLAFFNTTKYPPSLLYLLMTLGVMFLMLAGAERRRAAVLPAGGMRRALLVFGTVPLFFYLLHLPLIHGLSALDGWLRLRFATAAPGSGPGTPGGHDLPVVYAVWALVILMLYPVCARYAAYKRAHPRGWTRYF
jgi:uncharacterized membrane protein